MSNLEIPAEKVDLAYKKACAIMNKKVSLKGFRPGKIPQATLEKLMTVETLKYEAFKLLAPEIKELIGEKRVVNYKFELGEPLELEVE
jgi:FKBP-type peptidyl-prolyl cis-trans isomerase (trigger factor)